MRAIIERVQRHDNPDLQLLGYVVSKFKRARPFQVTYLAQIRQAFGDRAFEMVIPDLARFERSVDEGIPITFHSPHSHAADIHQAILALVGIASMKGTAESET